MVAKWVLSLPLACSTTLLAQTALPAYTRQDVMIPMRDGVQLHAAILSPAHPAGPLPMLMTRTPYGVAGATAADYPAQNPELAQSGYIFVEEDIRGRYGSGGSFVMMRPLAAHHDAKLYPHEVDESTDAYDTVAWLVAHVPGTNGRVGVFGVSYPGFLTMEAGIDPHPAVKAISPQAPMTDVWMGDDFFHNGAFRQTYGYDYGLGMESGKENAFAGVPDGQDAYDYFLKTGSFAGDVQAAGSPALPTWQAFVAHPAYDSYWQSRAVQAHLAVAQVPTLEVGGYWDQEDMWGPQEEYARLHATDREGKVRLALGPWNHGEWRRAAASLGALDWGEPTGTEFRRNVEAPFFAHYLKDAPLSLANTSSFQTGTNRWMHYSAWPPQNAAARALYLGPRQTLSFTAPATAPNTPSARASATASGQRAVAEPAAYRVQPPGAAADEAASATSAAAEESPLHSAAYTADPAHPIPYRARPIKATYAPRGSHWYEWLAEDQRPTTGRPDQLSWRTPPLAQTLTLSGNVEADLWAATSGTDADWVVKLIDEYPQDAKLGKMAGYQLMVAEEIFRGRYRSSFTMPAALTPNLPLEYRWSLHGIDHAFLPGHRLLVEVQSSWFPLYDRNPQTYVANIMTAQPGDYRPATQRIFYSAAHPSHLLLPVVPAQP